MLKHYYRLTKPGIVYGNVFTTLAAFLYASRWHFSVILFLATMVGIALVIASACVFNNYFDSEIDSKMERTKGRAIPAQVIGGQSALLFGGALGLCGIALLYGYVNALTAFVAFAGFFLYAFVYTFWKRASHWGVVVGSLPGAVPIVVGYTAVADKLDLTALLLFLILALWQMPHFYSIALYRLEEYKDAGIPILPLVKGIRRTKREMVGYIIAFIVATALLALLGYAGGIYLAVMLVAGFVWLWSAVQGFKAADDAKWARILFLRSLIVLVVFCVALSLASVLP